MNVPRTPRRPAAPGPRREGPEATEPGAIVQRKRTVKMHPAVAIALFSSPVVVLGILVLVYMNVKKTRPPRAEPLPAVMVTEKEDAWFTEVKKDLAAAGKECQEILQAREDLDTAEYNKRANAMLDRLNSMSERIENFLTPVKNPDGTLPESHSGYQPLLQKLRTMRYDLAKSVGF